MKRNIKHGLILFITLFLFVSNVLTESSDFFSLLSEIGNINNAEQDAVFAVGITPYTKSKTFKEINKPNIWRVISYEHCYLLNLIYGIRNKYIQNGFVSFF